jgi:hypothetical protein
MIRPDLIMRRRFSTSPNGNRVIVSALSYFSLILAVGPPVALQPSAREGRWKRSASRIPKVIRSKASRKNDGAEVKGRAKFYRIESENGNRFLHAYADKQSIQTGLEHIFDAAKFRRLRWRWRVHALPQGTDEHVAEKHDAAAQVYVVFDNQYLPRVIPPGLKELRRFCPASNQQGRMAPRQRPETDYE